MSLLLGVVLTLRTNSCSGEGVVHCTGLKFNTCNVHSSSSEVAQAFGSRGVQLVCHFVVASNMYLNSVCTVTDRLEIIRPVCFPIHAKS